MTDEELIAELRRLSPAYRHGGSVRDKLAGALMAEAADRLESRPPPQEVTSWGWCKRCRAATAPSPVPCFRCGRETCGSCGRCPPCDGDLPGEEE